MPITLLMAPSRPSIWVPRSLRLSPVSYHQHLASSATYIESEHLLGIAYEPEA